MRNKLLLLVLLTLIPTSLLAQYDRDRDDRSRDRYRDRYTRDTFELTPFLGYRFGGTIYSGETRLFRTDADVDPAPNFGVNFAIPLGESGLKLELMANRQSSELGVDGGIFDPTTELAEIDVTYFHAGVQIPFAQSRSASPYVVVSGGIANLDPNILGIEAENKFSASAGLGVKVPISRNVGVRLEGRGYYTALERDNEDCAICDWAYDHDFYQGEVNLGLVFSF